MGIVYSSHVIGLPFVWGLYYMLHLPSVHYVTWPGSWLCSCWHAAWFYTFFWLIGIEIGWVVFRIILRSIDYLGSSGTQWGLYLSLPPVRWRPIPPSPVYSRLSGLQLYFRSCSCRFHTHSSSSVSNGWPFQCSSFWGRSYQNPCWYTKIPWQGWLLVSLGQGSFTVSWS